MLAVALTAGGAFAQQSTQGTIKALDVYTTTVPKQLTKREALVAAIKNEPVYKCTLQVLNDKVQLVRAK